MAALRDRIRVGSGLAETSTEELSKLAGRDASPTTPMETSVLGGTPDQAKMAGTGQQKQAALRASIQGGQGLATRQRREQTRTEGSLAEKQKLERAGRLEGLSSLEGRVEAAVRHKLATETKGELPAEVNLIASGEDPEIQSLLDRLQQNPQGPESMSLVEQINQKLGRDVTNMATTDELMGMYQSAQEQIGATLSASVGDAMTSGAINFTDMGFAGGPNEVAELLGISPEQFGNLSIKQLSDQLNSQIAQEYSQSDDLTRKTEDPALGPAERAEARKSLKEAGAVGIRSAETDIDKLADEVAEANTVEFMGEEMEVEELLGDENMEAVVAAALTDPSYMDLLKKNHPELHRFVATHKNLFEAATGEIDEATADFGKIQIDNQKYTEGFDEDLLSVAGMQKNQLSSTKYSDREDTPGIFQEANDPATPPERRATIVAQTNKVKGKMGTDWMAGLLNAPREALASAGLDGKSPETFEKFNKHLDIMNGAEALDPANEEEVAKKEGFANAEEMRKARVEAEKRGDFLGTNPGTDRLLQMDSQQLGQDYRNNYLNPDGSKKSMEQLLAMNGNWDQFNRTGTAADVNQIINKPDPVYDMVKDNISPHGYAMDSADLGDILKGKSVEDMDKLLGSNTLQSKGSWTSAQFTGMIERTAEKEMRGDIDRAIDSGTGGSIVGLGHIKEMVRNRDNPHDKQLVDQTIDSLETLLTGTSGLKYTVIKKKLDEAKGLRETIQQRDIKTPGQATSRKDSQWDKAKRIPILGKFYSALEGGAEASKKYGRGLRQELAKGGKTAQKAGETIVNMPGETVSAVGGQTKKAAKKTKKATKDAKERVEETLKL